MKEYRPQSNYDVMYLSITELFTESWKTIFLRTDETPSIVAMQWGTTGPKNGSEMWHVIDLPDTKSIVVGGLGC